MAKATLSPAQISVLIAARSLDDDTRSIIRAQVFSAAKACFGIPPDHKLKVEIDDLGDTQYGVLIRKANGAVYSLGGHGQWSAPVEAPIPTRWFALNLDDLDVEAAVQNITCDEDFEGGGNGAGFRSVTTSAGYTLAVSDGAVYVRLEEAEF